MKGRNTVVFGTFMALALLGFFAFGSSPPAGAPGPRLSVPDPDIPPAGGAVIRYLGHCGYAVRTQGHFLVFDYQESRDGQQPKSRPAQPSLAAGWIVPEEIKNFKVRVFVSHSHEDHFDPVILSWEKAVPDIAYYFGWKASDNPAHNCLVGPRAELSSGGLEIATINSHHSGVPEVAWLVKVDGLVLYHNGDCQPDNPFAEHEFLKTKSDVIDLAFVFPVYREGLKYTTQNLDFFGKFKVKAAFPMHARAGDAMYHDFQKAFQARYSGLTMHVPMNMGHEFIFEKGKIENALAYVGEYELKPDFTITVTVEKDQLFLQATGQSKIAVFPSSEAEFFLKEVEAQISFIKDAEGKVNQLILHQGGADLHARRIK